MRPGDDPFDARPTAELLETDALLDRVGARAPTPDDLDDPLIAALALMAAEIDLDAVPVDETQAALARAVPELGVPAEAEDPGYDRSTGLVIDLRDSAARRAQERDEPRRPQRPSQGPAKGPSQRPSQGPSQRRPQPDRPGPPVAMAPPRSLARMPAPGAPGGPRAPRKRRNHTMRPMVAVAVAVMAIVLGSGVSAALTGGRSVNPLDGIQQVVAELTHGRTQDQLTAYEEVKRHLEAAQQAVSSREYGRAREELAKVQHPLLARLTEQDRSWADNKILDLNQALAR